MEYRISELIKEYTQQKEEMEEYLEGIEYTIKETEKDGKVYATYARMDKIHLQGQLNILDKIIKDLEWVKKANNEGGK